MTFRSRLISLVGISLAAQIAVAGVGPPRGAWGRMVEWTIESKKDYADPFNDVDVDVVFSKGGRSWRVPTFWRGGSHWTVRFAPPEPGKYAYHLESTDETNPSLNGHEGHVTITAYSGSNPLLKHGMLRVSRNRRYFEQTDGTPFYWLGDTLWTGLSDRLPWEGFRTLVADRQAKGFTVMLICGGLVPNDEPELTDSGFANEGGAVWDPEFKRINPLYFDYADRRIKRLVDAGIAPAIVGGWREVLNQAGSTKLKRHWRYLIARYGAYPVFWILGGEIIDPPQMDADRFFPPRFRELVAPGWTEVARYVRATDPYHHPLTTHEYIPPFDLPLQDPMLTDFDLIQPSHWGWPSIGSEVVQVNRRYARTDIIKPVVVGEIGYEMIGGTNLEDFQRVSFWLAMLNGAAGHTYGAAPTYEVNNPEKPMQDFRYTFFTWEEGMHLPGSYQTGLASKLLRQYPWWQFAPHPEWVTPGGTTLLEPNSGPRVFNAKDFDWEAVTNEEWVPTDDYVRRPETVAPGGEWKARRGTFRRAYAAGIAGKVRFVYMPYLGLLIPPPPTLLALEKGVRYHAYYWEPMLGIHFDLGAVEVPAPGSIELKEDFSGVDSSVWSEQGATKARQDAGRLFASGDTLSVVERMRIRDGVLAVDARSDSSAGLLLRYQDADNYVAVIYSARDKVLYLLTRTRGVDSERIGAIPIVAVGADVHLTAEARESWGAASLTDGKTTYSTPIVDIAGGESGKPPGTLEAGAVGLLHQEDGNAQSFTYFEVRRSPTIEPDAHLERKLYDARGRYRGELSGPAWDTFGRNKAVLLDAYRPERFPSAQDWVLVLEAPGDPNR